MIYKSLKTHYPFITSIINKKTQHCPYLAELAKFRKKKTRLVNLFNFDLETFNIDKYLNYSALKFMDELSDLYAQNEKALDEFFNAHPGLSTLIVKIGKHFFEEKYEDNYMGISCICNFILFLFR